MATFAITRQDLFGNTRIVQATLTFDDSYPTGGEAADPGLGTIFQAIHDPCISGFVFQYDYSAKKLIAYYADYDDTADGALIQVANEASGLDALVVRMTFIGA